MPGHNRPGGGATPPPPPGNVHRPSPGNRPVGPAPRPPQHGPGFRHPVPFFGPSWHRPVPPPAWRPPRYGGPSFGTILGITLGATIDYTLNALLNNGYSVSSYGNNVVYLTDVPQMNFYWPEAAMYYNSSGQLYASQFTYSTSYYDISRYNALYTTFTSQYGLPVETVNRGGVISATWYGAGNRFVQIEYNSSYGNYYTTLSFGN